MAGVAMVTPVTAMVPAIVSALSLRGNDIKMLLRVVRARLILE